MRAVGIDIVEIARFASWSRYSTHQLNRIFSLNEIEYCRALPALSAARLAVRFATKEAFLKAYASAYPEKSWSLLHIGKQVEIKKHPNGSPFLSVNWDTIAPGNNNIPPQASLSVSHTAQIATSIVILF